MAVLNRKLFNRGGPVSSRGVGITSGLVKSYKHGGLHFEDIKADAETYYDLLKGSTPERKPFNRLAAASPALLELGGKLLSGRSLQGGLGGGLDILGQAATASAPGFAQAIAARQEYDAADPEADLRIKALEMAIENQPDPDKEETFTGKELVTGKIPVIENNVNTGTFETVKATRLVGNQGTVMYKD